MKVEIIAQTQVRINKLFAEGGVRWVPKGGQTFRFPVDDEFLYNDDDYICGAIRDVLKYEFNNEEVHYEFLSFEAQFSPDIVVNGLDTCDYAVVEFGEAK